MKIAHFVRYGPHRSGMYETTRELCKAENEGGHDAYLVDTDFIDKHATAPTTYKRDRGIEIVPIKDVDDVDIHFLHSLVPPQVFGKAPILVALHGAPEYCFYSECYFHDKGDRAFSTLLAYDNNTEVAGYITFWKRHVEVWKTFLKKPVYYVPACVDLSMFQPEGNKYEFREPGEINIGICDSWRPTYWKDPFKILSGVRLFSNKCNKKVKLHIFGIPTSSNRDMVWDRSIKSADAGNEFMGDLNVRTNEMSDVYRSLDVVVSICYEENRIVRESMACGTPVITGQGAGLSDFETNFMFPENLCKVLDRCLEVKAEKGKQLKDELRSSAEKQFDMKQTLSALEPIFSELPKRN